MCRLAGQFNLFQRRVFSELKIRGHRKWFFKGLSLFLILTLGTSSSVQASSPSPAQGLIFLIEDAHGNLSAQKSIARILKSISRREKLSEPWIAVEGTGSGEIDHRILSAFPRRKTRKAVARLLLSQGEISGEDYFAAVHQPRARLFGVDHEGLARQNRQSYRDFLPFRSGTERLLSKLKKADELLKAKIYPSDLVLLDRTLKDLYEHPHKFLSHVAAFKFLARKYGLPKPELDLSSAGRFFDSLSNFTKLVLEKLLASKEIKDIHELDKVVSFYSRLFSFSLQAEDYEDYLKDPRFYSLDRLKERLNPYVSLFLEEHFHLTADEVSFLAKASQNPLRFYALVLKRDRYLVKQLLELHRRNPSRKTFLIAGGFHRRRLASELLKRKVPFVVLSPKIEDSEGTENYWKRLSSSTLKLENPFRDPAFRRKVGGLLTQGRSELREWVSEPIVLRKGASIGETVENFIADFTDVLIKAQPVQRFNLPVSFEQDSGASTGKSEPSGSKTVAAEGSESAAHDQALFDREYLIRILRETLSGGTGEKFVERFPKEGFRVAFPNRNIMVNRIEGDTAEEIAGFVGYENNQVGNLDTNTPSPARHPFAINYQVLEKFRSPQKKPGLTELLFVLEWRHYFLAKALLKEGVEERRDKNRALAKQILSWLNANIAPYNKEGKSAATRSFLSTLYTPLNNISNGHLHELYRMLIWYIPVEERGGIKLPESKEMVDPQGDPIDPHHVEKGQRFGPGKRFEILEAVPRGKGSFGAVYIAYDHVLKIKVAVKVLQKQDSEAAQRRLAREGSVMTSIESPYTPVLYHQAGLTKEHPEGYLVMTFFDGTTLRDLMEKEALSPEQQLLVLLELAKGLKDISKVAVHRDIKPNNILVRLDPKTKAILLKVIDFGLAKFRRSAAGQEEDSVGRGAIVGHTPLEGLAAVELAEASQPGELSGTVAFISPERSSVFQGTPEDALNPSVDIFALGITLYEMLTGSYPAALAHPFSTRYPFEFVKIHALGHFDPPMEYQAGIDPELNAMTMKLVSPAFKGMSGQYFESLVNHPEGVHFYRLALDGSVERADLSHLKDNSPDNLQKFLETATDQDLLLRPSDPDEVIELLQNYHQKKFGKAAAPPAPAVPWWQKSWKQILILAVGLSFLLGFAAAMGLVWWLKNKKMPEPAPVLLPQDTPKPPPARSELRDNQNGDSPQKKVGTVPILNQTPVILTPWDPDVAKTFLQAAEQPMESKTIFIAEVGTVRRPEWFRYLQKSRVLRIVRSNVDPYQLHPGHPEFQNILRRAAGSGFFENAPPATPVFVGTEEFRIGLQKTKAVYLRVEAAQLLEKDTLRAIVAIARDLSLGKQGMQGFQANADGSFTPFSETIQSRLDAMLAREQAA